LHVFLGEAPQDGFRFGRSQAQRRGVLIIWSYCWRTSSQSIGLLRISCKFAYASALPMDGN
jgi:hypothetical protein